jgi:hypothetical protein
VFFDELQSIRHELSTNVSRIPRSSFPWNIPAALNPESSNPPSPWHNNKVCAARDCGAGILVARDEAEIDNNTAKGTISNERE